MQERSDMTIARLGRLAQMSVASSLIAALAACGGGGGGSATPSGGSLSALPNGGATPAPQSTGPLGTLSFAITVPAATANTAARTVKYVSPSTQSIAISLKGQTTPLATMNLSATSPGCSATSAGTACTVSASAPVGSDMFVITAFDGQNGTGHQLSTANVPATITTSSTTRVPLTLNGTVTAVSVLLGSSSVQVGTPASVAVTVVAYDAQNNVIVGPGTFSTPVTLTDTDLSHTTTLSTTTVTAPGTSVSLNYNGNSITSATITPSLCGTTPTPCAATFTPTGSASVAFLMPQPVDEVAAIAAGPDGNTWFTADGGNGAGPSVGFITTSGATTIYTNGFSNTYMMGLVTGPDHNLWFGSDFGEIGTISTGTGVPTFATSFNNPCAEPSSTCGDVNAMAANPVDGNVWFTDDAGYVGYVTPGPSMNVTEFDVTQISGWPGGFSEPRQMAFFNGKLYVSDENGSVDQITLSGSTPASVVSVPFQISCSCGFGGFALTADSQGNIWFSDGCSNFGLIPASNFTSGGMLEWSATTAIGNNSFPYLIATPAGIFATDDSDGNLYDISGANFSTIQAPSISTVTAFSSGNAQPEVLAIGGDGNLWTASETTADEEPNVPPAFAKVVYSSPIGVAPQSLRRASAASSRLRTGKFFPKGRKARKIRRTAYAAKAAAARAHAQ
jgi:hypothetical protein